ncbi:tumor necrosis factor receptor superfamily member 1A [Labrus mixtus]|uniref:tumor necrosis factor receptor superfamily member 1A n=1 Tax=Labrus mixtus TaxID=508554 RepID=UPI0029BFDA1D|nr:tumor necrosis factor receptor superfamily member 1A [Labrus mixtus]
MDEIILLILAFLSTGLSYANLTQQTNSSCHAICPPGYYKSAGCEDPVKEHRCRKCGDGTFTDKNNSMKDCETCKGCDYLEVTIKPCTYKSDDICDCPERHYYLGERVFKNCRPCPDKQCEESADQRDCKRKCQSTTSAITTLMNLPTTTTTSMSATSRRTKAPTTAMNPTPDHSLKQLYWLFLVGVSVVTFLVLSWLLLLNKNPLRDHASCPFWSAKKDLELPVEEPKFNGNLIELKIVDVLSKARQMNLPRFDTSIFNRSLRLFVVCPSQALNMSEETPRMIPKQVLATQEHPTPTHDCPLLPATEHKAGGQYDHSEHWPAIVLYAIIKEVPLRRWKEFLRLLSVADQQLERVELEAGLGLGSKERQYQMLRLWSQRSSASLKDVFSALHHMDLSGCAQLLQESLEKLHLRWSQQVEITHNMV